MEDECKEEVEREERVEGTCKEERKVFSLGISEYPFDEFGWYNVKTSKV